MIGQVTDEIDLIDMNKIAEDYANMLNWVKPEFEKVPEEIKTEMLEYV